MPEEKRRCAALGTALDGLENDPELQKRPPLFATGAGRAAETRSTAFTWHLAQKRWSILPMGMELRVRQGPFPDARYARQAARAHSRLLLRRMRRTEGKNPAKRPPAMRMPEKNVRCWPF